MNILFPPSFWVDFIQASLMGPLVCHKPVAIHFAKLIFVVEVVKFGYINVLLSWEII